MLLVVQIGDQKKKKGQFGLDTFWCNKVEIEQIEQCHSQMGEGATGFSRESHHETSLAGYTSCR